MATQKKLTGKVAREAIRTLEIPRLPHATIAGFAALIDLTGTVSDAMDNLGLAGAIPASVLAPTLPAKRIVGQAVTVRNVERQQSVFRSAAEAVNRMGETEAYNLAEPGDVIVIEGLAGVSNMGGQSATIAHRQGCAGAVIDGSYRDPDASRELGFPIWARGVTQITGKWRLETVEINGRVHVAGVSAPAGRPSRARAGRCRALRPKRRGSCLRTRRTSSCAARGWRPRRSGGPSASPGRRRT